MKYTAKVNNLTIIFSGIAILSKQEDVFTTTIDAENGTVITFQFNFIDNDKEQKIKTEAKDNIAKITCFNFNNPLGSGLKEPVDIATILGKNVYIWFWCYPLGSSLKKFEYMFLMED